MTLRAIDMVTMLPRVGEAGRMLTNNAATPLLPEAQTQQIKLRAETARQQVQEKPDSHGANLDPDGRGERREGGSREKPKRGKKRPDTISDPTRGQRLDMKC